MGKALMLFGGAFMLALSSMFFTGVSRGTIGSAEKLWAHGFNLIAREVALSGVGDAKQAVYLDYVANGLYTGPMSWTGSYEGGSYAIQLQISGLDASIRSTGTYQDEVFVVERSFKPTSIAGVPPFMAAALNSEGNLQTSNDLTVQSAIAGKNANVFSNGNIEITNGTADIDGFGYYVQSVNISNGQAAADIFQPNLNPLTAPVTEQVTAREIPTFAAESFESLATVPTMAGLNLAGNYMLGTADNPSIWYVAGNVTTSADVTFNGYGAIIVTGQIEILHDVTLLSIGNESSLGFYTNGNIALNVGNLNVGGQWFANGNIHLESNTIFTGTMTTKGNFELSGPVSVNYKPASSALTHFFWPEGDMRMDLLSAQEWAVD